MFIPHARMISLRASTLLILVMGLMTILGLKTKRVHGISVAAGDFQIINLQL